MLVPGNYTPLGRESSRNVLDYRVSCVFLLKPGVPIQYIKEAAGRGKLISAILKLLTAALFASFIPLILYVYFPETPAGCPPHFLPSIF